MNISYSLFFTFRVYEIKNIHITVCNKYFYGTLI